MLLRLDHLVIAVYDPDDAAAELERRAGLACTGGGRHPAWGTYNRLAWFGDTYVELIGVFDHSLTGQGPVSLAAVVALDSGSEGLVSYAIATDGAVGDLNRLRAAGSDLGDVEARSRTRPDGEIVRWRASFPPALGPAEPPFIVQHEPVGAEWSAEARSARATAAHPLGGPVRVTGLTLPVPDVAAAAHAYRRTLGLVFAGEPPVAAVGDQWIRLVHGTPLAEPATIDLRTASGGPREVEALGVRWRIAL
jgi:hypothetical protein